MVWAWCLWANLHDNSFSGPTTQRPAWPRMDSWKARMRACPRVARRRPTAPHRHCYPFGTGALRACSACRLSGARVGGKRRGTAGPKTWIEQAVRREWTPRRSPGHARHHLCCPFSPPREQQKFLLRRGPQCPWPRRAWPRRRTARGSRRGGAETRLVLPLGRWSPPRQCLLPLRPGAEPRRPPWLRAAPPPPPCPPPRGPRPRVRGRSWSDGPPSPAAWMRSSARRRPSAGMASDRGPQRRRGSDTRGLWKTRQGTWSRAGAAPCRHQRGRRRACPRRRW
mmetsp:Transcript_18242/g.53311  ORF Transcript_18242/g.53311 Transcript_18242/m.53311 type:complete len:281 (+) Transcript_18242:459-1301(+)